MKHLILGFLFSFLASAATAQAQSDWQTLVTKSASKVIAVEGTTKIDISTAKSMLDRGVRFIDTRGLYTWKQSHIPGAFELAYPTEATLMEIVEKNEEVIFYCDCDVGSASCNRSPNASAKAVALGYQNVYYFTNSNAWGPAGYPLEKAE
jgi:rhodanese-related sulfurtransferase